MGMRNDGFELTADMVKATGHPVRLRIMQVLREGEACVCHLEAVLGQRQAYISQQLMRLRDAGLVTDRREGMNVFYSLTSASISTFLEAAYAMTGEAAGERGGDVELPTLRAEQGCSCPNCQAEEGDVVRLTEVTIV